MPDAMEEAILNAVDERRDEIVELVQQVVRIPSPTGEEADAQQFLAEHARKLGADVQLREPDTAALFERYPDAAQYPSHWRHDLVLPYERRPTYDALAKSGKLDVLNYRGRPNVVGVWKGDGGGRSMLLTGHVDTVTPEPADAWERDPYGGELAGGILHGRGTADMKAGLAAALAAVGCLRDCGVRLRGDVIWASVVNEEHSGNGTLALIADGLTADAAIVPEPTGLDVFTGTCGNVYWQVTVRGVPRSPGARWEGADLAGVSAIEKLPAVIAGLLGLESEHGAMQPHPMYAGRAPMSCVMGEVSGGTYATVTAAECVLRGCVYFTPGLGTAGEIMDRIRAAVAEATRGDAWFREHPAEVAFLHHRNCCTVDPAHPLIGAIAGSAETALGRSPATLGAPYAADMDLLVNEAGIPTVLFGPGSIAAAHKPNESVAVDEVTAFTKAVALAVCRWCG